MIKIGVISAASSYPRMKKAEADVADRCELIYLNYDSLGEIEQLYLQNRGSVDGFLFSGQLPYSYLVSIVGTPDLPCIYCDVTTADVYELLLKLAVENPQLDYRRIFIAEPPHAADWNEVFPPEKMPHLGPALVMPSDFRTYGDFYAWAMNTYIGVAENHATDLIVTRVTNIAGALRQRGYRCCLLQPSARSVVKTVDRLLLQIQQNMLDGAQVAFSIVAADERPQGVAVAKVEELLGRYNIAQNMPFIIRCSGQLIEMTTSNLEFKRQTANYTQFALYDFLKERLGVPLPSGTGVGGDIVSARDKAMRALQESRRSVDRLPVIVAGDHVIVPLARGDALMNFELSNEAKQIAAKLEMSPFNIQQILAIVARNGSSHLTSEELAGYMGIKQRSAARILGRLESSGAAQLVHSRQLGSKGRPQKVYAVDLGRVLLQD